MGKLSVELYLNSLSKRYRSANKTEKSEILNELCESSGFHKNTRSVYLIPVISKNRVLKRRKS